jgi:hypothetical protein
MRVLLDECLPRRLVTDLVGHAATTVPQAGWAGVANGALLARIGGVFDCFITVDKNLPAQNLVGALTFGVIVLRASSNRLQALRPLVPEILEALGVIQPGQLILIDTRTS